MLRGLAWLEGASSCFHQQSERQLQQTLGCQQPKAAHYCFLYKSIPTNTICTQAARSFYKQLRVRKQSTIKWAFLSPSSMSHFISIGIMNILSSTKLKLSVNREKLPLSHCVQLEGAFSTRDRDAKNGFTFKRSKVWRRKKKICTPITHLFYSL